MAVVYRAERAVSPNDGSVAWVVVDADYDLHVESCAFLASLRGQDRSINTERLYAGRLALFLSWCAAEGIVDSGAVGPDGAVQAVPGHRTPIPAPPRRHQSA